MKRRLARRFPNYDALDASAIVGAVAERTRKLERIYRLAHDHAWDGRQVLADCIARHGGIKLPQAHRESLARIFSIILWGELAAWVVSAELAEQIDDVEAKMAATSQTFDEARHFYVMRDYLRALDVEVPPLDGYTRVILRELLATENLVFKLVGMQLLVENAALGLFKMVARSRVEPVLADLMPYFEKDEARHVGLGINYLPQLLRDVGTLDVIRLNVFQARIYALLFWGSMRLREDFDRLGLDANESTRFSLRLQLSIASQVGKFAPRADDAARGRAGRAVYVEPEWLRKTHSFNIDAFLPRPGTEVAAWHRTLLRAAEGMARVGERWFDAIDP